MHLSRSLKPIIGLTLTSLLLSAFSAHAATALLHWIPGNGTAQRVERQVDGGAWTVLTPLAGNATTYTDASVPTAQAVCYRIQTSSAAGDGPPSPSACVATVVPTGATGLTVIVNAP